MAKQSLPFVAVSDIHPYNDDNTSRIGDQWFRSTKDEIELIASLVHKRFDYAQGVIGTTKVTDADKRKLGAEEREKRIELLSRYDDLKIPLRGLESGPSAVNISGAEIEKEARLTWCTNGGKGKATQPNYDVVFGFRRTWAIIIANAVLRKLGLPLIEEIPVQVLTFETKLERELVNVRENTDKATGLLRQSEADTVFAVRRLFWEGAREVDLQAIFGPKGRGQCQKYHRLCRLDQEHPDLQIIDRCMKQKDDADYLNVKSLHKERIQELLKGQASDDEVEAYVTNPRNGNDVKMADKKAITGLTQNPLWVIAWVAKAILENDTGRLNMFNAKAKEFNDLTVEFQKVAMPSKK